MNPHRKGNAFPQAGVPGDPRLLDQLHRQMVRGPNMQITHVHSGTLINPNTKNKQASLGGPFCKKYSFGSSPATIKLLGGIVSGGAGNITVPDIELGTVGSEPADGTHHWLQVSFTAYMEDDVLLPGGDVTAVSDGSGSTLPDNTPPTSSNPDGTVYISLGSWVEGKFVASACGNIQVSHCLGYLSHNH